MLRPLLATVLVLFAALLAPAAASAGVDQVMTFEAPRELLDDKTRDRTLDQVRGFGVDRVRALVYWREFTARPRSRTRPGFDRADPNAYPAGTWTRLDNLVLATQLRGMAVQMTLTGPVPRWATRGRRDQLTAPDAREFGRWATAVARRYGDRVNLWSVWNEPNQPQFLLPQYRRGRPVSPRLYRGLYRAAERAIHGVPGGGDDIVLFGETSPVGNARVVKPLTFLRGALCLDARYRRARGCGKLRVDGYAHHAYTKRQGPSYRSQDTDEVTIGTLDRLVRALDRAGRARAIDRGRDIYLTEFGIQSLPDTVAGVSWARQAEYLAIAERIAYANPRVVAFSQYLMNDDPARRARRRIDRHPGFETGLRTNRGRPKPSYRGFQLPLAVTRYGDSDVLWGRVRPARGVPAEVTIQRRVGTRGWRRLTALQVSPRGVFGLRTRHRRGQVYRAVWSRPDGSALTGPAIRPY